MNKIALNQAKLHVMQAKDIIDEVMADERKEPDLAEKQALQAIIDEQRLEVEALRRDFSRILATIMETDGGVAPHVYYSSFRKELIENLWKQHDFDVEFDGEPEGRRGIVVDIPLTFDRFQKEGKAVYVDEAVYGVKDHLHTGCTYNGTIWMDLDSWEDFKNAIKGGLQVEFWTSARE